VRSARKKPWRRAFGRPTLMTAGRETVRSTIYSPVSIVNLIGRKSGPPDIRLTRAGLQRGRWSMTKGGHGTSMASSRRRSHLAQNSRPWTKFGSWSECRGQTHARSPDFATPPNRVLPVLASLVQPEGSSRHAFSIHLAAPRIALIGVA